MEYKVHLNMYNGPLDLLCDLVIKSKIDIKEINIIEIINQYIDYIEELETNKVEVSSDFMIMATRLLNIKSKHILKLHIDEYENEEDEDSVDFLAEQLKKYIIYKNAANYLREKSNLLSQSYCRVKEEIIDLEDEFTIKDFNFNYVLSGVKMMLSYEPKKENIIEMNNEILDKIYKAPIISVQEKMNEISRIINEKNEVTFSKLITQGSNNENKDTKIANFLALLELSKLNYITTTQEKVFEEIWVKRKLEEKEN